MNRLLAAIIVVLATASADPFIAAPASAAESPEDAVLETLDRAAELHQQALELEHGWSVTEPLLQEARESLVAGDLEAAQALSARALLTAGQSLEQARREATAWESRVVQH
ncbi:MAG: hypothetical protein ACI87W_003163 [Halieaceae bacterium]|jgi:hypothetical protein